MRVFEEKQWFNQWWLQLMNLGLLGLVSYMMYRWYILKLAFDKVSADDTTSQIMVIIIVFLAIGLIYLFNLKTIIDERGVHYQFFPFHRTMKAIPWSEIEKCYTRTYKPLSEYGGWGYRFGMGGGKALNIKGNQGIQLKLKNGNKLLIGTQKPEDAQIVINKYFKNERI